MEEKLFFKYIQNRCSSDELERVRDWFNNDSGRIEGRSFLYKFWVELKDEYTELNDKENNLLNRIHHDVNVKNSEILLEKTRRNPVKFRKRKELLRSLAIAATIILIPLMLFSVYMAGRNVRNNDLATTVSNAYTRVYSPVGSVSQIDLPDGTQVWLNHNTTLVYPNSFNNNFRQVSLSGEAFFKVKHDPHKPFIVKTDKLNIVAKGTEFNVMNFPGLDRVETILKTGKVELQKIDKNGQFKTIFEMQENELASYFINTNNLEYAHVNPNKYTSWKEGKLVFENDPLDQVAERLSRFYNVEIIIKDKKLAEYTYTATFEDETLYQVMELLKLATPIDFAISSRKRLEDGNYTKRKVYIRYKGN